MRRRFGRCACTRRQSPRGSRKRSAQNFSRFSFVNTLRTSNSPVLSSLQSRLSAGFLHCQQFWFLCIMDTQTRKDSIDQQTLGRSDCKNALTTVCSALPSLIFTAGGIRDAAWFFFVFFSRTDAPFFFSFFFFLPDGWWWALTLLLWGFLRHRCPRCCDRSKDSEGRFTVDFHHT